MKLVTNKLSLIMMSVVWIAVVLGSVAIVMTRRQEYGWWVFLVPAMALLMLVAFVLSWLPTKEVKRSAKNSRRKRELGFSALITGGLILTALVVLGGAIILAIVHRRATFGNMLILGLFFVIFLNIFKDFVRDHRP